MEDKIVLNEEATNILDYLGDYFTDELLEKDSEFIKKRMDLDVNGEVKIKGILMLPLIGVMLGLFLNGFALIGNFESYTALGVSLLILVVLLQLASLIFTFKRKKYAKFTFMSIYVLMIVISLIGGLYMNILVNLAWLLYFSLSKRVKYTFHI